MENNMNTGLIKQNAEALERLEIDKSFSNAYKLGVAALAVAMGIILDIFFYDRELGLSYPIFTILLLACFFYVNKSKISSIGLLEISLLIIIILLSLTFAIFNNGFFRALNFLGIPVLIAIFTIKSSKKDMKLFSLEMLASFLSRTLYLSFICSIKPFTFLSEQLKRNKKEKSSLGRNIIIGLLVSFVLLTLIIPMLVAADMAFKYYFNNMFRFMEHVSYGETIFHIIFITVSSLYFFGYVWSFKYPEKPMGISKSTSGKELLEPAIVITVLIVINILYLLFTAVQFSFLYAGANRILPDGLTYAEYARTGFFDLVRVTVLNLIIVLTAMKQTKQNSKGGKKAVKILLSILIMVTVNLLISAFYRMSLYEQAYGYTELRIYVFVFMLFLMILFAMVMAKLWYDKMPLLVAAAMAASVIYVALNYANVEGIIAKNNIERYYKTSKIDMVYLGTLSADAAPQIARLIDDENINISSAAKEILAKHKERLKEDQAWFEYNYNKSEVKQLADRIILE